MIAIQPLRRFAPLRCASSYLLRLAILAIVAAGGATSVHATAPTYDSFIYGQTANWAEADAFCTNYGGQIIDGYDAMTGGTGYLSSVQANFPAYWPSLWEDFGPIGGPHTRFWSSEINPSIGHAFLTVHQDNSPNEEDLRIGWGNDPTAGLDSNEYYFLCEAGDFPEHLNLGQIFDLTIDENTGTATITGYWTAGTPNQQLVFWQNSDTFGQEGYVAWYATTTGAFNFTTPIYSSTLQISATSTSYTFSSGTTFNAQLWQLSSTPDSFTATTTNAILLDSETASLTATTTATVITGTQRGLSMLPEPDDCSVTKITGCIKNAFVWLLYPSNASLDRFASLNFRNKFPFEYVYEVGEIRNALFASPLTASTTVGVTVGTWELTFLSPALINAIPYTPTIKLILGWLMWILVAEYIYYRVIRVHDSQTPK